ncbi:N/A [soil metagenome]
MRDEDVVALYTLLLKHGVQIWIDGGWGIDALLNQQTRFHKDLDALVHFDNLPRLTDVLDEQDFTLKEIWSENRWVFHSEQLKLISKENLAGNEVATAFVLRNGKGHELDFHVLRFDSRGYGIPAWNADFIYPPSAFEGHGIIRGTSVRCLSPQMQMATHTGYALQDKDLHDLRLLHERFGVAYLEEHAHRFPGETA